MTWLLLVIGVSISSDRLVFLRPPPPISQWYAEHAECLSAIATTLHHPRLEELSDRYGWHVYCVRPAARAPPDVSGRGT